MIAGVFSSKSKNAKWGRLEYLEVPHRTCWHKYWNPWWLVVYPDMLSSGTWIISNTSYMEKMYTERRSCMEQSSKQWKNARCNLVACKKALRCPDIWNASSHKLPPANESGRKTAMNILTYAATIVLCKETYDYTIDLFVYN